MGQIELPVMILDIEQDGDEWHKFRGAGIGSSDVALLMSDKPVFDRTLNTLWCQKVGYEKPPVISNIHTARGKELEPEIREMVNDMLGTNFEPACMYREDAPYLRASLDGIDYDKNIILEIKSPSDKVFNKYLEDWRVPENYYYQIQYQMLVAQVDYAVYSFYNELYPHPFLMMVENNFELQYEIEKRCKLFWKSVEEKTPIGWHNGELMLFQVKPTIFFAIGEVPDYDLPVLTEPKAFKSSFVYHGKFNEIATLRSLNPNHDFKIVNQEPSPFGLALDVT